MDFDEVFAPVVKWSTICTITARASQLGHDIHHLDVKTTFLYGDLEKEVYMEQPQGFIQPGEEHLVCKLQKTLYGLKQSPARNTPRSMHTYCLKDLHVVRTITTYITRDPATTKPY